MGRSAHQDGVSSLQRGLSLLELFSAAEGGLSISEMARRSGMPKSTVHRLVNDLMAAGMLERGPNGMQLGVHLIELAYLVPVQRSLRELAAPYAHHLKEATQLTCNLAIRDGDEIFYIEKISTHSLRVPHSRGGGRLPMHCTALGKAILAVSDESVVEPILNGPLPARTAHTITEPEALRRELARVREMKVAYDVEESELGLFCVAAPIFDRNQAVVGAISVTGATELSSAQRFAPAVLTTAKALTHALQRAQFTT